MGELILTFLNINNKDIKHMKNSTESMPPIYFGLKSHLSVTKNQ